MPSTTVRADQSQKAWCNWLLVTQHCVAFIKGCCTMWLRRAGSSLLMCGAIKNPTADSKHSPALRLGEKFEQKYYSVSVSLHSAGKSGETVVSVHRDETGNYWERTKSQMCHIAGSGLSDPHRSISQSDGRSAAVQLHVETYRTNGRTYMTNLNSPRSQADIAVWACFVNSPSFTAVIGTICLERRSHAKPVVTTRSVRPEEELDCLGF